MSKTITIPEGIMNPFVVGHNGITYTYKPGETVEVPDGVALEIEKIAHWNDKFRAPVTPPIGIDAVLAEAKAYTDSQRLAYEETVVKPMLDVTTVSNGTDIRIETPHHLEEGVTYPVTVNGVTLEMECWRGEGNLQLGSFVDDHAWIWDWENGTWVIRVNATDEHPEGTECRVTIDIPVEEKVVHTVNGKYLPVGGVGYEETKVTKLVDAVIPAGEDIISVPAFDASHGIDDSKPYRVTLNGRLFEVIGIGGDAYHVGDWSLESEPFYVGSYMTGDDWRIRALDPDSLTNTVDRHIVVEQIDTIIHTIEPKFLPGVCLPVVECSLNIFDGDYICRDFFDAEKSAMMDVIEANKSPFILKLNVTYYSEELYLCCIVDCYTQSGTVGFGEIDRGFSSISANVRAAVLRYGGSWCVAGYIIR